MIDIGDTYKKGQRITPALAAQAAMVSKKTAQAEAAGLDPCDAAYEFDHEACDAAFGVAVEAALAAAAALTARGIGFTPEAVWGMATKLLESGWQPTDRIEVIR